MCEIYLRTSKLEDLSDFLRSILYKRPHMWFLKLEQRGTFLVLLEKPPWPPVPLPHLKVSRTKALPSSGLKAAVSFPLPTCLTSGRGNGLQAPLLPSPLPPASPEETVSQPNLAIALLELGALVFKEQWLMGGQGI